METGLYHSHEPYPPVRVEGKNAAYAEMMLSNLGGRNSEMTAVGLYLYNHFVTRLDDSMSETFLQVAIVEMHHYNIFGELACLLGADPRMWVPSQGGMRYWSPTYLRYLCDYRQIVQNSQEGELAAIRKYRCQMEIIKDKYILENLVRIIQDEENHVRIFRQLLEELGPSQSGKAFGPG